MDHGMQCGLRWIAACLWRPRETRYIVFAHTTVECGFWADQDDFRATLLPRPNESCHFPALGYNLTWRGVAQFGLARYNGVAIFIAAPKSPQRDGLDGRNTTSQPECDAITDHLRVVFAVFAPKISPYNGRQRWT
jgi:hypothetical protein